MSTVSAVSLTPVAFVASKPRASGVVRPAPASSSTPTRDDPPSRAAPLGGAGRSALAPATQLAAQEAGSDPAQGQGQPSASPSSGAGVPELSDEQQAQVQKLKQRDAEVRRHEQAHMRAGGSLAGAPSYDYVRGPDGRQYVVNGEVSIDTGPARTPEATISKMELVIRAALAPADPSAQDRSVAAAARKTKAAAQAELRTEQQDTTQADGPSATGRQETATATEQALALYRQTAAFVVDPFGLSGPSSATSVVA